VRLWQTRGLISFCNFSAATENHYLTYGSIAARNLGADLATVAWSGKGIVYNYGDDKTRSSPVALRPDAPWRRGQRVDFSWQPDAVVINLGHERFLDRRRSRARASSWGAYTAFLGSHPRKIPERVHPGARADAALGERSHDGGELREKAVARGRARRQKVEAIQ
jgi:hypothetical protein